MPWNLDKFLCINTSRMSDPSNRYWIEGIPDHLTMVCTDNRLPVDPSD
jgi:hypothetical protein